MSVKFKLALMTAVTFLMIFSIGINYSFARISQNGSGNAYEEDDPPEEPSAYFSSASIESYIELGAGYYLKAREYFDTLLNLVESENVENPSIGEMKTVILRALENMRMAQDTYNTLVQKAENTPYNEVVIGKLNQFDYIGFMEANHLNSIVFEKVGNFLKRGQVTEMFSYTAVEYTEFVSSMENIHSDFDNNIVPEISVFWSLNERFSGTSLFGGYMARVFHEIQ